MFFTAIMLRIVHRFLQAVILFLLILHIFSITELIIIATNIFSSCHLIRSAGQSRALVALNLIFFSCISIFLSCFNILDKSGIRLCQSFFLYLFMRYARSAKAGACPPWPSKIKKYKPRVSALKKIAEAEHVLIDSH